MSALGDKQTLQRKNHVRFSGVKVPILCYPLEFGCIELLLSTQRSSAKGVYLKGLRRAEDKLKLGSEMALLLALVVLMGLFATGLLALLFLK
jgi:hypothetical protein